MGTPKDLDVGLTPDSTDPKVQANHFLEMLRALGQHGSAEAKRIREGLITALREFDQAEDKKKARDVLATRVAGMEAGVAQILFGTTRKLRDQFVQKSRVMGTRSPAAKTIRDTADAFTMMADALGKMLTAAKNKDAALRKEAQKLLNEAEQKMKSVSDAAKKIVP